MAMTNYFLALATIVCIIISCTCGISRAQSLAEECTKELPQVMACVAFASGKESTPQQKCCDSVTQMKNSNPACLCFLIQQIHNGTNPALKQMNIQESKLLQLPSACKIADASISNCPKLLKLPPNSPDAAIFNNVSSTVSPTTGGATSSPTTTGSQSSHGFKYEAHVLLGSIVVSVLYFLV